MKRLSSFAFALGLCSACAQIIGLSDYEKVGGGGASGAGGSTSASGGKASKGGTTGEGGELPGGSTGEGGVGTGGKSGLGGATGLGGALGASGDIGTAGVPEGGTPGEGGTTNSGGRTSVAGQSALGGRTQVTLGGAPGTGGVVLPPGGSVGSGGGPACTSTTVDLLADDGNFDGAAIPVGSSSSVTSGWYQDSSDGVAVVQTSTQLSTSYGVTPLSSPRAAVLGGAGDYQFQDRVGRASWVGKLVTIPATATAVTFACRVRVDTAETSTTDSYDFLDIWLWDDSINDTAFTFDEFTNLDDQADSPGLWWSTTHSVTAEYMTAVAGKTLAAEIYGFADDLDETNFFVDNCTLKVTYCN